MMAGRDLLFLERPLVPLQSRYAQFRMVKQGEDSPGWDALLPRPTSGCCPDICPPYTSSRARHETVPGPADLAGYGCAQGPASLFQSCRPYPSTGKMITRAMGLFLVLSPECDNGALRDLALELPTTLESAEKWRERHGKRARPAQAFRKIVLGCSAIAVTCAHGGFCRISKRCFQANKTVIKISAWKPREACGDLVDSSKVSLRNGGCSDGSASDYGKIINIVNHVRSFYIGWEFASC